MTPPASTETMHCGHECVCPEISGIERSRKEPCDMKGTRAHCPHDTRARGPVVAQQAPASDICMDCDREPATCKNDPSKCQHDPVDVAALIAQEREKWEREQAKAPTTDKCFVGLTFEQCQEVSKQEKERAAAQAREDVLKEAIVELNKLYKNYSEDPHQSAEYTDGAQTALDLMEQKLESLRSEVGDEL